MVRALATIATLGPTSVYRGGGYGGQWTKSVKISTFVSGLLFSPPHCAWHLLGKIRE